jgi:hypothetical protein
MNVHPEAELRYDRSSQTNDRPYSASRRHALTLLEVVLALGLTVVATGLIGGLIQIYQSQLELAKDNVRQTRLARSILTMIADDIRGSLREYQNDDAKTLEQFLTASAVGNASQSMGGMGGSTQSSGITGPTALGSSASVGSSATPGTSSADGTGAETTTTTTASPPSLIGTDSIIEVDVSRPPRPDEYYAETKSLLDSRIVDVPSDSKKVTWFVQAPQLFGIQDPLNQVAGVTLTENAGLVRRALDRSVARWANENGQTQQMAMTGQILAPEVIALSFSYFDGTQWLTTWDSTAQGLPWAVQITIAMQHAKSAREAPITPGTPLSSLLTLPRSETGLETYSLLAIIPGVQLLKNPADQTSTEESSTSSLGF